MRPSLVNFILFSILSAPISAFFDTDTSEELVQAYPALESNRTGNELILCPFLRLLERSGRLDDGLGAGDSTIDNDALKTAAEDFGCDTATACGPVIDLVSAGQSDVPSFLSWFSVFNPFDDPEVDLERLWDAPPVSHDCGFTFGFGEKSVSELQLNSTFTKLASRMDANGRLTWQNISDTKLEICREQGVQISNAGETEARLIYAYLGGVERGYVEYSDVRRFLQVDNQLPLTKAAQEITAFYLLQVN